VIPAHRPSTAQSPPRPMQPAPSLMNGPSLSPRGQALGPPGIQRSEAAYGSPLHHTNGSSPTRPYSPASRGNGLSAMTPPRYQNPATAGSPFSTPFPLQSTNTPSYVNSFSRPSSSGLNGNAGPVQSPVKHSSPRPSNGVPNAYNFNSPYSSFPPSSVQETVLSPTKHSSPPPHPLQMSSPAPAAPLHFAPSPVQNPAQILPDPIPAPAKHDARPVSSHSERMVMPPVKALPPSVPPQDLSPPTKKSSPAPINGNGFGSSQ
jgi:hypothetical protein